MSRIVRSALLALAVVFGVVSMSVGINSLVKSNQQKAFIKAHAPAGVTVFINTDDVLHCGEVLTVASGLLALLSFVSLAYTSLPSFRPYAPKTLRLLSYLHFVMALWVLATVVAFDVIARTRSARLSAFLGTFQLTDAMIAAQEQLLGMSPAYWSNGYLHTQAILPWFAFLFGALSGIALFRASNQAAAVAPATTHTRFVHDAPAASSAGPVSEKDDSRKSEAEDEKADVEVRDGAEKV